MDTGKILTGFAFILLSVALITSPSSAEMADLHGDANSGQALSLGEPNGLSPDLHEMPVSAGAKISSHDPPG